MSAFSWTPQPRPDGHTVDIFGARCRCGRRIYTSLVELTARTHAEGTRIADLERCRGCDELAPDCFCPEVPVA